MDNSGAGIPKNTDQSLSHNSGNMEQSALTEEILRLKTELKKQAGERTRLEKELKAMEACIEEKVRERTRELSDSNLALLDELSEHQSVEESLRESENRLRFLAETTGDVLYRLVYKTKRYDYLNPAIEILTGYSKSEINRIGLAKLILKYELHDLPHNRKYSDLKNINFDECTSQFSADYLIRRKDGKLIWVGDHSYPWRDETGKIIGSVGVLQDITKRKYYENTIKRHDAILKAISLEAELFLKSNNWKDQIELILRNIGEAAQTSRIYIFQVHKDQDNKLFFSMTYEWAAENIGAKIADPLMKNIPADMPFSNQIFKSLMENKVVCGLAQDFAEGNRDFLLSQGIKSILHVPIFINEEIWGFIGLEECLEERVWSTSETESLRTAADILGAAILQNNFEQELIKAKEIAERSNQLKTDFLTQMSHEIRTPLNNILNYASLVREEVDNRSFEALPVFFDIISNSGKRLTRTIDLILNMSQIQTKNYEPQFREMDLYQDILKELLGAHAITAAKKGITFLFEDKADRKTIVGDSYTVMQIFDNLIDNAVKYTPKGEVNVAVHNLNGSVLVDIKDTGVGISKDYLPELFTPFSQEEMGYSRKFDGNGLGLALVKKYVELNKGEILVTSEKDTGSFFRVKFNLNP